MQAAELADRHLPVLEAHPGQPLLELPHHQRVVESVLLGKAARVHRLEALQELALLRDVLLDEGLREVGDPVVEALVAQDRRELRVGAQGVFPLLVEQRVELLEAVGEGRGREGHGEQGEEGSHAAATGAAGRYFTAPAA